MPSSLPPMPSLPQPVDAPGPPSPPFSEADDEVLSSGSDVSQEDLDEEDGQGGGARERAHAREDVPASLRDIVDPDELQDIEDDLPRSGSEGRDDYDDMQVYDGAEDDVAYDDRGEVIGEVDYERDDEPAVDIDVADLTGANRANDASRHAASTGGGSGGGSGGGGGGSGSRAADAFPSRSRNPLARRSGTGNGSKKGKGWRAASLPVEIIDRIIDLVANQLLREAQSEMPDGVRHDDVTLSGYPKRDLMAYLQSRWEILQLRLVARSWRRAVDRNEFWYILAYYVYGDRVQGVEVTQRLCRGWLTTLCLVCVANGYRDTWKPVDWLPSMVGRIPCCKFHKNAFCYRCLFGPFAANVAGPRDKSRCVLAHEGEGDADWFGIDDSMSCRPCRLEALNEELRQKGYRRLSFDTMPDVERAPAFQYLYCADGDAVSTVEELVERHWLNKNTKFGAILEQALESRRFAKPARRPRDANDLAAIRRAIRGEADEDDMSTLEDDKDDYDEFESDEDEDEDETLTHTEIVQVAEMALLACLHERVVNGYWLSPGEQHLALYAARARNSSVVVLENSFVVAQPLGPYDRQTTRNSKHMPFMSRSAPSLLPRSGPLLEGQEYVYASALRGIIYPAMEQIVRVVSQVRDPIKLASSYQPADILKFLRLPGCWIPGGLDYLVPDMREHEARRASTSTRSSISSTTSVETPSDAGSGSRPDRQQSQERRDRSESPFIGPKPPKNDQQPARDGPSPMQSVSSHSPSPSTTVPSVSTPPSSTSPPPNTAHAGPPPSPRKQGIVHLPNPALPSATVPGSTHPVSQPAAPSPALPPLPPLPMPIPAANARPIQPIPCIPALNAVLGQATLSVIHEAWYSAWEPLRRCHCAICLRGMGFPTLASGAIKTGTGTGTETAETERNGNGKRKGEAQEEAAGLVRMPKEAEEGEVERRVVGLGLTGSDDDGSVKRARTETA